MNQDFVSQLQLQLREAALREERRAPLAQRFVRVRRGLPGPAPLAVAVVVALLAVAVAIGALKLRGEPEPVKPKVIQTFTVANSLSSVATGFGSVWAADVIKGEILRIDPKTRKVTTRIPVGGEVFVATGEGAVWALGGDLLTSGSNGSVQLSRIDPRTNRVVARIPLRRPDGDNFAPLYLQVAGKHVWVVGAAGARRVDPATNKPDRFVGYDEASPGAAVAAGERVWVLFPEGRLDELDARTGRTVANVRLRGVGSPYLDLVHRPGTLMLTEKNRMTLIERRSGRALWRASFDGPITAWRPDGDTLWVHVSHDPAGRDQLVRVDAETSRHTGQVALPQPGAVGVASVGRDIWVATPGGTIMVVR